MVTQSEANYSLNIGIHVFILFTFLTVFFFVFASNLAKKSINNSLSTIIDDKTGELLNELDKWDKKIKPDTYPNIKWDEVNKLASKIVINSENELPEILKHNTRLKWIGIVMIISLLVFLIGMYLYYRFVLKLDVHLGYILIENIIIFAFIGAIEAYFFLNIASKYIPVTPDFVATTVLERIKKNTNKIIFKNS